MPNKNVCLELRRICESDPKRMLKPAKVVRAAENPKSPLHRCFTWDNAVAGQKYRLIEARQLIASYRVFADESSEVAAPVFINLPADRAGGRGYRFVEDVVAKAELRSQMLDMAVKELDDAKQRYRMLNELAGTFGRYEKDRKHIVKKMTAKP
jgi:hypothetical protein